jgi:hypothetical protein
MATAADSHLPTFDYTKMTAINTCPTWGIMRYTHHKAMSFGGRAMALEAGKLMHDCFSVIRLYQLGYVQNLPALMHYHGVRMFGTQRWNTVVDGAVHADAQHHTNARNLAWNIMSTADWVDDPDDKKRTYAAMEASIAYYCERWDFKRYPVWVRDARDPKTDVGIEIPFDVVVEIEDTSAQPVAEDNGLSIYPMQSFRLTGRIDGLHVERDGSLILHENKTGKVDNVWRNAIQMSHQPTGYCVAATAFSGQQVSRGLMIGMSIPLARSMVDSIAYQPIERPQHMLDTWTQWAYHTVALHEQYVHDVSNAPRYTHSCNRFYRTCSMLPYCTSPADERKWIMEDMVTEEWSPLAEGTTDD